MAGCGDDLKYLPWEMGMSLTKNKLLIVFGAVALLAAGGYFMFLVNKKKDLGHDIDVTLINPSIFDIYTHTIQMGIRRVTVNSVNLKEISFSYPDELGFGDKPSLEVFNPSGGGVTPVLNFNAVGWKEYASAGNRPIFSLSNRVIGSKSNKTELIVIYPGIFENVCRYINEYKRNSSSIDLMQLKLLPFPYEPEESSISTLSYKSACVRLPDGKNYYYDVLVER